MCNPALLIMAGGTAMQMRGQAQEREFNHQMAMNNMVVKKRMADDALRRGRIAEDNQRLKTAQTKGRQRAALGAAGVELQSGSASDLLADTAFLGELDALTIRHNAELEARGHNQDGLNLMAQDRLDSVKTRNSQTNTLLTGATSVASGWYDTKAA